MITMNRFEHRNMERKPMALLKEREWSFTSVRLFKARSKRGNCVFDIVSGLGEKLEGYGNRKQFERTAYLR